MIVCDQQLTVCCATEWAWQNKWEHCAMIKCQHSTCQHPSKQDQCAVLHFFVLKVVECWKVWASPVSPGSYIMWLACICSCQEYPRSYECIESAVILAAFHGDLGLWFHWLVCQWGVWFKAYGTSVWHSPCIGLWQFLKWLHLNTHHICMTKKQLLNVGGSVHLIMLRMQKSHILKPHSETVWWHFLTCIETEMRNMLLLQTHKLLPFFLNFLDSQLEVKMQIYSVEGLKLTVLIYALQCASWQFS